MTTYPLAPSVSDVLALLKSPTLLARRFAELVAARNRGFMSNQVLTGRYTMTGGALVYFPEEQIEADDEPEDLTPGGEYPMVTLGEDALEIVAAGKKGFGSKVSDEAVSRLQADPVDRALNLLANKMISSFDSGAMSMVASAITQTHSGAAWSTATNIIANVEGAKAAVKELELGYELDSILLKESQWAAIAAPLLSLLPREAGNPVIAGGTPQILGVRWLTSPNLPAGWVPTMFDSMNLGGIAHEAIPSPEYATVNLGANVPSVEIARYREQNDSTRIHVRKADVPVVRNPLAGIEISGTGL